MFCLLFFAALAPLFLNYFFYFTPLSYSSFTFPFYFSTFASSVVLYFAISVDLFLTILISYFTLPVLQTVFAIFISVFNSFYVPLCLSQVVTLPPPLPAVPLRCPTAMIPWKAATIQVCFNHKHIVHLINRHTDRYIIVQSFCSGVCSLPCVLLKLLHLLSQKI